ncbi:MAG TPA: DUF2461 domain-containing protein [Crocinitomix sp.]|nr:DUF2461 domain-containing protein [Crocinitomix sp.]
MSTLNKQNLIFLKDLKKNNNRDWFSANKHLYEQNRNDIIHFADDVLKRLNQHDNIETVSGKKSVYRIYRDVRFSKDKTPYKIHWGGYYKRATKLLRGGYYFHIEPKLSFVGGGFWNPNSKDLKKIRTNILEFGDELLQIINSKEFKTNFGELKGKKLKTAPKGFDKNHKYIDLLRYKQFLLVKPFTDEEVLSKDFALMIDNTFKAMRPFFNFMSEALTTNENGEIIV